jgi:hypothetical protein
MIVYGALPRLLKEVHDLCVVTPLQQSEFFQRNRICLDGTNRHNPRMRYPALEQVSRPHYISFLPCFAPVTAETVDEDDAVRVFC